MKESVFKFQRVKKSFIKYLIFFINIIREKTNLGPKSWIHGKNQEGNLISLGKSKLRRKNQECFLIYIYIYTTDIKSL